MALQTRNMARLELHLEGNGELPAALNDCSSMMGFRFLSSLPGDVGKGKRERNESKTVQVEGGGRVGVVEGETRKIFSDGLSRTLG